VKYLADYHNYLKVYWRYTQENQYWREAQFEAAKAQIAKQNNIAPKGVSYDDFPKQIDSRGKRVQSAKERAEKAKQHVLSTREAWMKIQHQADTESGKQSSMWDPMANPMGPTGVEQRPQQAEIKSMPTTNMTPAPMPANAPAPEQPQPQPQPQQQ
jgi:hypothetical protein